MSILSVTVPFSCFPLTTVVLPWIIAPYGRGVPLDHFICPGPRYSAYVQDHDVLGNVIDQVCLRDMWGGVVSYCEIFVLLA